MHDDSSLPVDYWRHPPCLAYRKTFLRRHVETTLKQIEQNKLTSSILGLSDLQASIGPGGEGAKPALSLRWYFDETTSGDSRLYQPGTVKETNQPDPNLAISLAELILRQCPKGEKSGGIILLTADPGTGKTTACWEAYHRCLYPEGNGGGYLVPCWLRYWQLSIHDPL
jgi:hypothetical protein